MRLFVYLCITFLILSALSANVRVVDAENGWTKSYGGDGVEEAHSILQTGDGGYVLAGSTSTYGQANYRDDGWLVKVDSSGNMQWQQAYGGTETEELYSLVQTSDGGYALAGRTNSSNSYYSESLFDGWLVKVDSLGSLQWEQIYGGAGYDGLYSLVQTSDGGYALAGYSGSYGAGNHDIWFIKTDSAGNQLWNKTYGGKDSDVASSLVQTSDGGYALAGRTNSYGAGGLDSWFVKTDSTGNQLWSKTYGGIDLDETSSLVQTSDGGYALAGLTRSFTTDKNENGWLVKVDSSGNMQWQQNYGEGNNDFFWSVVQTSDGGYALAGKKETWAGSGNDDAWLVKVDSSGNVQWDKIYGGSSDEQAEAVIETSDHGFALAGYTYTYVGGAYDDFWLVKTDSNGVATVSGFDLKSFLATVVAPIVIGTSFVILIILKLNEQRKKARKKLDEKAAEQLRISWKNPSALTANRKRNTILNRKQHIS